MKTAIWNRVVLGSTLLLFWGCSTSAAVSTATSTSPQLFTFEPTSERQVLQSKATGYLAALLADPANAEVTLVKVNPALVSQHTQNLAVDLPGGKATVFQRRSLNSTGSDIEGWVGYVPSSWKQSHSAGAAEINDDPLYYLSIVRQGEELFGRIVVDGQPYRLDYVGSGQHALIKVDESKLPPDGAPVMLQGAERADSAVEKAPLSSHSTIRVLLVSTMQAREKRPNYKLEMTQALQDANQYFINSRVNVTYELAGLYDADYDETNQSSTAQLNSLKDPNHPLGKAVYVKRDALRADLVSMYSTVTNVCGQAINQRTKEGGYSIFSCSIALAHELGHNFGGGDGWKPSPPENNYRNGYKHESTPVFHTRMVTSHGALGYFSNPRISYQNIPMGTDRHDMTRQIDDQRETVENYYPPYQNQTRVTVYDDVAMKGDSCTFEVPSTQTVVLIDDVCPGGWKTKIWSARVQGIGANTTLRLGNEHARHTYRSDYYVGDFDISTLTAFKIEVPDGMIMEPSPGNLSRRVDRVTIQR